MRGRGAAALLRHHCSGRIWRLTKSFLTVLSMTVAINKLFVTDMMSFAVNELL